MASLELATPQHLSAADADTKFTEAPILSMRPGPFVRVVSKIELGGVIHFCRMTPVEAYQRRDGPVPRHTCGLPNNQEFCCTML